MPGITTDAAKHLKWKSLFWMLIKDEKKEIRKGFFKHPLKYGWTFLKLVFKSKSYKREGDFFLYGVKSLDQFQKQLEDSTSIFVLGFSYCHKPFECPSGRFTDQCMHDPENLICQQCFIGKAALTLSVDEYHPTVYSHCPLYWW